MDRPLLLPPDRVWEPDERPSAPELKRVLDPEETAHALPCCSSGFRSSGKALIVEPPRSVSGVPVFSLAGEVFTQVWSLSGFFLTVLFSSAGVLHFHSRLFFLTEVSAIPSMMSPHIAVQ